MAQIRTFACELEAGDVTVFGVVRDTERYVSRAGAEKVTIRTRTGIHSVSADCVLKVFTGRDAFF